jgi:fatty acid desaturase
MAGELKQVRRHAFSADLRRQVQAHYALDNLHGPLELLEHWSVILLATAGSCWAWASLPPYLALPAYLCAIFLIGGRQRALSGVLHQACHRTLMKNRRAGTVLGAVFGGHPVLQSYTGYVASHLRAHHSQFGDPEQDPDYQFFVSTGLYGAGLCKASLRRYLFRVISPAGTVRYIAFLIRHRILPADEDRRETAFRLATYATVAGLALWTGFFWILLAYWLVPLVTTHAWIGSIAELLEHYPLMEPTDAIDIHMSRNREFGLLWDLVVGEKHGEGYHLVHHLFPRVPQWRLSRVHELLKSDPAYAALEMPRNPVKAFQAIYNALPGEPVSSSMREKQAG